MTTTLQNAANNGIAAGATPNLVNPGIDPNTGAAERTPNARTNAIAADQNAFTDAWANDPAANGVTRTWVDPSRTNAIGEYEAAWNDTPLQSTQNDTRPAHSTEVVAAPPAATPAPTQTQTQTDAQRAEADAIRRNSGWTPEEAFRYVFSDAGPGDGGGGPGDGSGIGSAGSATGPGGEGIGTASGGAASAASGDDGGGTSI